MKPGKYNIRDFFVNRYLQKLIIPEIQRDYVWGEFQVQSLIYTILKDYKSWLNAKPPLQFHEDPELALDFFNFYRRRKYVSNIGFVYAYNDSDYPGKYFLIDGQQRITTIYILLLLLANRNHEVREHFKRTFLLDGLNKLDYKVRETAHDFLYNLTTYFVDGNLNIVDQIWLYEEYKKDMTVMSILNNIEVLNTELDKEKLDETEFYNYLCEYVEFWYFDTNISEQGEELYIYMNARGEQMQSNENIKSDLLSKLNNIDDKNSYGCKWENWQDFFWKHRDYKDNRGYQKNENADKGFNEFLCCISGLENLICKQKRFYSKEAFDKNKKIDTRDILASLSLPSINKYIAALEFIENAKENFKNQYTAYNSWGDNCISEIWQLLNNENTNWLADYNDANRATERNRMIFLWSILYFITEKGIDDINSTETFRFMRMFYVRYHNFNRSVTNLIKTVDLICINGVLDSIDNQMNGDLDDDGNIIFANIEEETDTSSRTSEERKKANLLNKYIGNYEIQKQFEEIIWKIEDHKYNLNGKDVGATNITHLIELDEDVSIEKLKLVDEKFNQIFPEDEKDYTTIQSTLLYYGEYWYRVSPYSYFNYEFDNWRRIIRGYTEKNKTPKTCFKEFFEAYSVFNGTLQEFIKETEEKNRLDSHVNLNKLIEQLIWYSQELGNDLWSKGNYIALREWAKIDGVFTKQLKIFNTQGDFKGYRHAELFTLLPDDIKSTVLKLNQNLELCQAEPTN